MRAFESINEVTLQIYDAVWDPGSWPGLAERLRVELNAAGAAIVDYDFSGHACRVLAAAGTTPDFIRCYEDGLVQQIPWVRDGHWYAPGRVSQGHEITPEDELVRSPVYHEWLKPNGLFHRLCGVIGRCEDRVLFVVASRPQASGRYDDSEVAFLATLLPHLRRAARLRCKIVSSQAMATAFEHLPHGVFVLDGSGRPVRMNRAAETLLKRGDLQIDRAGRLAAADAATSSRLERAFSGFAEGQTAAACDILAPPQADDGRLPIPISVIAMAPQVRDMVAGEGRTLVLAAPLHAPEWQALKLRERYGLTAAEERLARLILQGLRLDQSEAVLGIRHSTARTHMRRIYEKTGTRRQVELVRLLMSAQSPFAYPSDGEAEPR